MDAVVPSEATVAVLRAISRAGFVYDSTKALCDAAGWELVDDEPDLGYVRYDVLDADGLKPRCVLSVQIAGDGSRPWAFVPLFHFKNYDATREAFDQAFRTVSEKLIGLLGAASRSGVYSYPHRSGWAYSFVGWSLLDATLVLVQDEFDIQFGMDVTLWIQPTGAEVAVPVRVA